MLALLNSDLITYYLRSICPPKLHGYFRFNANSLNTIPIPLINENSKHKLEDNAKSLIKLTEESLAIKSKFMNRIKSNFKSEKLAERFDKFYEMDFDTVVSKIAKETAQKLSLKEQDEWESYFLDAQKKYNGLAYDIQGIHKQVNQIVYEIYHIEKDEREMIDTELSSTNAKDLFSY